MPLESISIRGAREHNLRGFDLDLPRDRLVVITGLSGSGKSSLAFSEDGVERQGRLAGTRQAGEDDHLVAGHRQADVLQVVFAGAANHDRVLVVHG